MGSSSLVRLHGRPTTNWRRREEEEEGCRCGEGTGAASSFSSSPDYRGKWAPKMHAPNLEGEGRGKGHGRELVEESAGSWLGKKERDRLRTKRLGGLEEEERKRSSTSLSPLPPPRRGRAEAHDGKFSLLFFWDWCNSFAFHFYNIVQTWEYTGCVTCFLCPSLHVGEASLSLVKSVLFNIHQRIFQYPSIPHIGRSTNMSSIPMSLPLA